MCCYTYSISKDVSSKDVKNSNLDEYKLTKLKVTKTFSFKDDNTRADFYQKYDQFCAQNRRDAYQSYGYQLIIADFKEKYLTTLEDNQLPRCMTIDFFWCFTGYGLFSMSQIVDKFESWK